MNTIEFDWVLLVVLLVGVFCCGVIAGAWYMSFVLRRARDDFRWEVCTGDGSGEVCPPVVDGPCVSEGEVTTEGTKAKANTWLGSNAVPVDEFEVKGAGRG